MRTELLEIGKDFVPIVKDYTQRPRYERVRKIMVPRVKLSFNDFLRAAMEFNERMETKGKSARLEAKVRVVDGQVYYVLRRADRQWKDDIPIYYNPKTQRFYIPKRYPSRRKKLTSYVIMLRLSALGVKYRRV